MDKTDLNEQKIEEHRREFLENTEKCITQTFLEQILELNKILENPDYSISGMLVADYELDVPLEVLLKRHAMYVEERKNGTGNSLNNMTEKINANIGIMPHHKTLQEMLKIVNPFFQQLLRDASNIKMWLSFLTPKMEDGNNFGVEIQEKILNIVHNIECINRMYFKNVTMYNTKRGKLCTKLVKHPYVEDFIRAIDIMDEQHYLYLTYLLHIIRDSYVSMNDIIVKNWEKLIVPKSSNSLSLY